MACFLESRGYRTLVLDNFSTSRRPVNPPFEICEVDLSDWQRASQVWKQLEAVNGVIHFAAHGLVGESCAHPDLYFRNNLLCTMNMARLCAESRVPIIHSSSCAVYGVPSQIPISEGAQLCPISPYGETKRASEEILKHTAQNKGLQAINLRYFNPAGAYSDDIWGESHEPETHLIPSIIKAAMDGSPFSLFGENYDTPDGTCIRDFVHVEDLIEAHLSAFDYLQRRQKPVCLPINVGSGRGYSVREVIQSVEQALNTSIKVQIMTKRPGDPPRLVADTMQAQRLLQWKPRRSLLEMIRSHITWQQRCLPPRAS